MAQANEYPRMVYAEDGRSQVVNSEEDENNLDGAWSREPSDVHRNPPAISNSTQITSSGDEAFADMVADRVVARLRSETADADASADTPPRRGPGRPPKTSF